MNKYGTIEKKANKSKLYRRLVANGWSPEEAAPFVNTTFNTDDSESFRDTVHRNILGINPKNARFVSNNDLKQVIGIMHPIDPSQKHNYFNVRSAFLPLSNKTLEQAKNVIARRNLGRTKGFRASIRMRDINDSPIQIAESLAEHRVYPSLTSGTSDDVGYSQNMRRARARNRPAPKTVSGNKYLDMYNQKKSQGNTRQVKSAQSKTTTRRISQYAKPLAIATGVAGLEAYLREQQRQREQQREQQKLSSGSKSMNKRGTIEKKANKSKLYRQLMAMADIVGDNPKDIISFVSALPRKYVRSQKPRIGDASLDLDSVNSQGYQNFVWDNWDDYDYTPVEYALNMQDARARNRPAPKTAPRNKYLDRHNQKKSRNEAMASYLLEQRQREQQEKKLQHEAFISRVRDLHQKKLRDLHQKKQQENL